MSASQIVEQTQTLIASKPEIAPGKLFIGGQWRDAQNGETKPSYNPFNDEVVTTIAQATVTDLEDAVKAAQQALSGSWSKMKGRDRAKLLNRIADLIDENLEDLAYRQVVEMGKTISQSRFEISYTSDLFRYHAGWAGKLDGTAPEVINPGEFHTYTRREPIGVVCAITPFNVPIYLMATKAAAALAAGCTFIHKPASTTSVSALKFAEILQQAGVPDGVFNLITGPGGSLGKAISRHRGINKIGFTGSTEVGVDIVRESAATMKRVSMELGGKSPHVVLADADLETTAQNALIGNFTNSGQICTSGSRLIVERPVYAELVERLKALLDGCTIGDPLDPNTFFGPVASKHQQQQILQYFDIGHKDGATAAYGGDNSKFANSKGAFVQPTLFTDANNQMRIAREEIFGPILTVIPVADLDEAISVANDTDYGLASYIETRDPVKAHRFSKAVEAGTVWINTAYQWDSAAPYGGYKLSGYGRENGMETYENYTQLKTVWWNMDAS